MKRVILFCTIFTLFSCSIDDDSGNIMQELAPTVSVEMPENMFFGQTNSIAVTYKKPSSCHYFSGFDVSKNGNTITVGVVTSYRTTNTNCSETGNLLAVTELNFVAERNDFYIFKFWRGTNSEGENLFLTREVTVTRPVN